jgi:hypothetical protein
MSMKNSLFMLTLLCAGLTIATPQAGAQTVAAASKKEASKKPVKKVAKKAPAKTSASTDDDKQPDIAGFSGTNFNCELGNKITVYEKASDNDQIKLRWNKRVHELKRVATTTGANRFEDKEAGLVWIHIPAKAMLLDSKKGQQLANECRSPQQMKAAKAKA